jgi:2-haloacid dehalogenase
VSFDEVAAETLAVLAAEHEWELQPGDLGDLVQTMSQLDAYADAEPTCRLLRERGIALAALTNGTRASTEKLLKRAKLDAYVRSVVSIDDVGHWKPRAEIYLHAARTLGCAPNDVALVAAHGWDTHGARSAGLVAAWVGRSERRYHRAMQPPDVEGATLVDVAGALVALPAGTSAELRT